MAPSWLEYALWHKNKSIHHKMWIRIPSKLMSILLRTRSLQEASKGLEQNFKNEGSFIS